MNLFSEKKRSEFVLKWKKKFLTDLHVREFRLKIQFQTVLFEINIVDELKVLEQTGRRRKSIIFRFDLILDVIVFIGTIFRDKINSIGFGEVPSWHLCYAQLWKFFANKFHQFPIGGFRFCIVNCVRQENSARVDYINFRQKTRIPRVIA